MRPPPRFAPPGSPRGPRASLLLHFALALVLVAVAAQAASAQVLAPPSGATAAVQFLDAADAAARAGDPARATDLAYRASVAAYAASVRPSGSPGADLWAQTLYRRAVAQCLTWASQAGRLDPRSHLLIAGPGTLGLIEVPILHQGFLWQPSDFNQLIDPERLASDPGLERPHRRAGLGAPMVAIRFRRSDGPIEPFYGARHPFVATALIVPDLDAWTHPDPSTPPADRLVLLDPRRVGRVQLEGQMWPLAADFDSNVSMMRDIMGGDRYRFLALLRPDRTLDVARLFMVEPYQPGKIPVILVHGLWSSPTTWSDLQGDLECDREITSRYQLWTFTYPTGMSFLASAEILRNALDQIVPTLDPSGADPSLRSIVLVTHSMGGLIGRLQTTSSGDALWSAYSSTPFDEMVLDPALAERLRPRFFFEPQPYVSRVVFIATPHRGAMMANQLVGRLSSRLIREPADWRDAFREMRQDNPGAMNGWLRRRPPTSIDLLQPDHPILIAINELPRAPGVAYHSIIGVGGHRRLLVEEPTDGVVAFHSAALASVDSEILVDARHANIHHRPETTAEVRRILLLHSTTQTPDNDPDVLKTHHR
jgi:hypothetical protein